MAAPRRCAASTAPAGPATGSWKSTWWIGSAASEVSSSNCWTWHPRRVDDRGAGSNPLEVAMTKVLIITGDAAEDLEVMYPYQRLLEEGYEVDLAAPAAKKLQFVVHDFV